MAIESRNPVLMIEPQDGLFDTPFLLGVSGLAPGQPVKIKATTTADDGECWSAQADFVADDAGRIDTGRDAPVDGSYTGTHGNGLLWSMQPFGKQRVFPKHNLKPIELEFVVEVQGVAVAGTRVVRRVIGTDVERIPVRKDGLVGTLFLPPGTGPHAGVLVLGGSDGGRDELGAALLASHGLVTFALAYFKSEGLPAKLVEIPMEYFEKALGWLQSHPKVDRNRIGVRDGSRGGKLALLLGATFPAIKAVVAVAPSGVVWGGYDPANPLPGAAWTYRDEPIPYLSQTSIGIVPWLKSIFKGPRDRPPGGAGFMNLASYGPEAIERATIRVERTNGAILMLSGEDDALWPATQLADVAYRRLREHNHPFPFAHLHFPGAGHLIGFPPNLPTSGSHVSSQFVYGYGGTAAETARACNEGWTETVRFLLRHLSPSYTRTMPDEM